MIVKPPRLRRGSTVAVVAPAGPCYRDDSVSKGIRAIEEMGFNVVEGRTVHKKCGYLAGSDYERAEDINYSFYNDDIDGIICLRGGYGTLRILERIDYGLIRRKPKVFVGYSDITALHAAISKKCGMVTFHGPMVSPDFGNDMGEYMKNSFLQAVAAGCPVGKLENPDSSSRIKVLYHGEAKGRITGGNLSVIISTIGTPYEMDLEGRILILEEIGEEPYRIDRMLTQLLMCGKLKECGGIVLGQWKNCEAGEPEKSQLLMDVFIDRLIPLNIPILCNVAFGHDKIKMTIPLGVMGTITNHGEFIVDEAGVI